MINWFARNQVAVNFLMLAILGAGAYSVFNLLPLEVFPERDLNQINISVAQRAASPRDVELGITNRIEESVADLPYIDELTSRSSEQSSFVTIKLQGGTDKQQALNEVKTKVEALSTLPQTAERPIVEIPDIRHRVLNLMVSGDIDEKELALIARKVRDDLVRRDDISVAKIAGVRPYEIGVEISQDVLRAYNLTLSDVASAVRRQAVDISAGQVRTAGGEILLRSERQAYDHDEYADVIIKQFPDGSVLKLGQIARVEDGFDENPVITRFNGKPSAIVQVFRVGKESAISVSESVKAHLEEHATDYPTSIEFGIWDDDSEIVRERLNTLLTSGWQGAILILILLSLFLHPSVALWVVVGIPVCFAGALAMMPLFGLTINALSLFSFILVLGVVVDDAIVTGENIYAHRSRGINALEAAIGGTKEISTPVIFGVVTTMLAFVPMLMLPTDTSFFGDNIAGIVIPVLAFSLIESKLILPSHLSHLNIRDTARTAFGRALNNAQTAVSDGLQWFVENVYQPAVQAAVNARYVTVVSFIAVFMVVVSLLSNGWIKSTFMPIVASDTATATVTFPVGSPFSRTRAAINLIELEAVKIADKYKVDDESVVSNIMATIGVSSGGATPISGISRGASNIGSVQFEINPDLLQESGLNIDTLVKEWRQAVGTITGAEKLAFRSTLFDGGSPVYVQLEGQDVDELQSIVAKVREKLASYDGVFDIEDTLNSGKRQLLITPKPEAELLGLTTESLTQQVRHAFFGSEAQRIQRGRDDIRVMVRYPQAERNTLAQLENLLISTPQGAEARFGDVADVAWSRSASNIYHSRQLRTTSVEADVDPEKVNASTVNADLILFLDELLLDHPNVGYSFEGERKAMNEFINSFQLGLAGVLVAILGLLSIAFRSYLQPLIIMSVIPFSVIGAILGHMILGIGWSLFSYFGLLALIGVVINDSLVLVDWINRRVDQAPSLKELVIEAGRSRFRPVMLTSLTTFFGLLPILFQTSVGSAFLKPMAVSLSCGILFATFLTLVLVPCNYLILDDCRKLKRYLVARCADALADKQAPDSGNV